MAENEPEQIEFLEELHRAHERRPFQPFDVATTSGDRYAVQEAAQFAIGHSAVVLVLPRTGVQIVRLSQITALHVHAPV